MMCENTQSNLPVYFDDVLASATRDEIEKHLAVCPVCRGKAADFQALKNDLRRLARPALSARNLTALRQKLAREIESKQGIFSQFQPENRREWLRVRWMPYTVGTAASLLFTVTLLWTLLSTAYLPENNVEFARSDTPYRINLTPTNSNPLMTTADFDLSPANFAATRYAVSGNSPSLNPQGALVALTKSIVRGKMKDDEVVVVADVFGDGLAHIAEIVEPSSDSAAVRELEKALKNDPRYAAPFVPANMDGRSDSTVRVIFKINRVDIQTHINSKSSRSDAP